MQGKLLRQALDKFMKSPVAQDARVQVVLPNGEFYDIKGIQLLENKKYEVDYGKHIAELGKIRQAALAKGAWSAAVNAEVARGKAAGLYIEQKIIRTGKLEDLTAEELESRMKTIIDEYSPILEGVDEKELKERVLSGSEARKNSS